MYASLVVNCNVLGETWPYFRPNFVSMQEILAERGYAKAVGFVATGWMYETKKEGFEVRVKDPFEIHLVWCITVNNQATASLRIMCVFCGPNG
jgi:hypothetical protein